MTTNDPQIAEFARTLRDHGQTKRYFHDFIGYNYRMDGFQGAVLRVKLAHLDEWNTKRRQVAQRYRELLEGAPLASPPAGPCRLRVQLPLVCCLDQ